MNTPGPKTSPFTAYLGIEDLEMQDGTARLKLPMRQDLLNSGGMAHGGVLASVADCVAGAAVYSALDASDMGVTSDFNLCCLKAARGACISATASLVHRGRRFLRASVEIHCDDVLVATAGVSFLVIERPPGAAARPRGA